MDQKGNSKMLIIVLIVIVLLVGFYWWNKKQSAQVYAPSSTTQTQESGIQNDQDLTATAQDLDNTDIDGPIDNELNQNDADASSL